METLRDFRLSPVEEAAKIFDQFVPGVASVREWEGDGKPVPYPGPCLKVGGCLYGENRIGQLGKDGVALLAHGLARGEIATEEVPTAVCSLILR